MDRAFEFEDGGRTYTCRVEDVRQAPWWWFDVTGDRHRYAPFRVAAGESQDSVRSRIVGFYVNLLERRAAPHVPYGRRGGTPSPSTQG